MSAVGLYLHKISVFMKHIDEARLKLQRRLASGDNQMAGRILHQFVHYVLVRHKSPVEVIRITEGTFKITS